MRRPRQTARPGPAEQAEAVVAAIRRAEEAAAARLTAQQADQADIEAARERAAELLAAASRRAQRLAGQRREAIRAEFDAEIQREQAAGAAQVASVRQAAQDAHDLAVRLAVTFVLTGEVPQCSSR